MIDSNEGGMGVQSAVIRPERSRLFAAVAGLLVLTGLMAFFPSACVGLALLTPLLGCPLAGSGRQWPPGWPQRLPPPCPCSTL